MRTTNAKPVIGQYFFIADEGNRTWAVKFRSDIPFDKLTRLYIAFAWIRNGLLTYKDKSNTPTDQQRIAALVDACRKKNLMAQIYISSGYDDNGSMYKQAANNPSTFANSVVAFLRENKLDGYDMDWENGLDRDALNKLLTALHNALDAAGKADGKAYGLTLAVWPSSKDAYDLTTISKTVDAINIMSYGVRDSLQSDAQHYANAGFPRSKMIGGIDTEADYSDGVDSLGPNGTIIQKARYAWQNSLAGMMAWRLDNDYVVNSVSTYKGAIQLLDSMPVPVYLYATQNPSRYYYTTNPADSPGPDWSRSGIAFIAFGSGTVGVIPVRQHSAGNPQRYSYDITGTLAPGWTDDNKTSFYAYKSQAAGTVPVYQYHTLLPGEFWNMFYSLDPNVSGWIKDGVAFYVYGA